MASRLSDALRETYQLWVALGAFASLAYVMAATHVAAVVDDAYISFIYARNLADGRGLTYTDGERIEGFTDFLWVVATAGGIKAGMDPEVTARALGVTSALLLIGAVWLWCRWFSHAPANGRLAPIALALSAPVVFWSLGGLETVAFTAFAFLGLLALTARAGDAGAVFCAACLVVACLLRPDGVVFVAACAAFLLSVRSASALRRTLILLVAFLVPFGAFWCWRWAYFGDLMPNTYYAKDTRSWQQLLDGLAYPFELAQVAGFLVVLALLLPWAAGSLLRRTESRLLLIAACAWLAYTAYIGGDGVAFHRFMVPVVPLLLLLLQEAAVTFIRATHASPRAMLLVGGSCIAILLYTSAATAFWGETHIRRDNRELNEARISLGRWFARNTTPSDDIAVSAAGAIPYFAERPAIDMLGLNDRHIAHNGAVDHDAPPGHKRYDAEYVLDQSPTFIVLNVFGSGGGEQNPVNRALLSLEAFSAQYVEVCFLGVSQRERVFARRDRASGFAGAGALRIGRNCV